MVRIVDRQLRVTSWRFLCVTKHPEFPNIAIQLELLAVFSLLFFFFLFLYNKGRQSQLVMTPVLFHFGQEAAIRTRPAQHLIFGLATFLV